MNDSHTYEGIAAQFAAAKAAHANEITSSRSNDPSVKRRNLRQRQDFRFSHGLLVALLLCFCYLHGVGIFLFTKGFLLTRMVLEHKSSCRESPLAKYGDYPASSAQNGCWYPKTFDKAVVVVIDALRWDFTIPFVPEENSAEPARHFHNAFTGPYRIASEHPKNAILLPFIADPPTTTLQRLKGLTTGSLPTFMDAGSNFAGTSIDEDNLLAQMRKLGKRIAFLGDDTWTALFPEEFEQNVTHPYESLNVWDLHTVDNGVNEHIFPLLKPENSSKWDVLIAHYLGVDHAGHRYGPDHFAMTEKLNQMDGVVQRLAESIDDDTLLVVMGDHGMDSKGDHGGESQGEIEAALWMYSKKPIFGRLPQKLLPDGDYKARSVAQIDLVPTLSLLLGLPIPFNNLGAPIAEAFLDKGGNEGWKNLAQAARLTAAQIRRYQWAYSGRKGADIEDNPVVGNSWKQGEQGWTRARGSWPRGEVDDWIRIYSAFADFQAANLDICKSLWAKFDLVSMGAGILVLTGSVGALLLYARGIKGDGLELTDTFLLRVRNGLGFGTLVALGLAVFVGDKLGMPRLHTILFCTAQGIILGLFSAMLYARRRVGFIIPSSGWGVLSVIFTVLNAVMFGSNSFTINEDKTLTFFLATFAVAGLIGSQRNSTLTQRLLGTYHSIVLLILTRVASLSRLCREEQMPYCQSTFYASATSSVSAPWSLALLFAMALVLPSIIKSFYSGTRSYEGPAPVYLWIFQFGLFVSAAFWTLDSADNASWWPENSSLVKSLKLSLAQMVLAMGLIAGNIGYAWSSLCLGVDVQENKAGTASDQPNRSVYLLGYANTHGSRYFLLVLSWALALMVLQKPMGGLSLGILLWQILSILEIIDANNLSSEAIGPVVFAILGNSHFFSTGHQATLASIQWESAFIPMTTVRYPWSPLLVVGNTLGPQILTAIAVPLVALWKAPPKRAPGAGLEGEGLLWKVAKASSTFVLYHAVIATSSVVCAGWLRRHLMLYRIFNPRFMLGAVTLLVAEVVAVVVGVGGVRWNAEAVGALFGYWTVDHSS